MGSICAVNNNINYYSVETQNTKDEKNEDNKQNEESKAKGTIGIRRGNYIYEYEVYEDGSKKFLLKIPVEKEESKNDTITLGDKNKKNQLEVINDYKENIRSAAGKLTGEHDSLKDLIKMAY